MVDTGERTLLALVRSVLRPGETVLAAVSGGADSVALLRLLCALRDEGAIRLFAAHYEHGIRGEESVSDMRFVCELCGRLAVPLTVGRGDVPQEAARLRIGLEEAARDMRHAFLEGERRRLGADVIALAHHADDQAETVLMRILRGSAGAGAAGMRERSGALLRPLLGARKADLTAYLTSLGQPWREDATNAQPDSLRNALRLQALPVLEAIKPGCVEAFGRFAAVQAEESDFLNAQARRWLCERATARAWGLFVRLNGDEEGALLSRAFKEICGHDASFADIERLRALCGPFDGNACKSEAHGIRALRERAGLWILTDAKPPAAVPIPTEGAAALAGVGDMRVRPCKPIPLREDPYVQALDASACLGAALRTWREGDRIAPLGMAGHTRLVSDLFARLRVPLAARPFWPVLERDGEIIWAVGLCLSDGAKVAPGRTAVRLEWSFLPPLPYSVWSERKAGIQETGGRTL